MGNDENYPEQIDRSALVSCHSAQQRSSTQRKHAYWSSKSARHCICSTLNKSCSLTILVCSRCFGLCFPAVFLDPFGFMKVREAVSFYVSNFRPNPTTGVRVNPHPLLIMSSPPTNPVKFCLIFGRKILH